MRSNILTVLILALGFIANSQTLSPEKIAGLWKTKAVHIADDVPEKEAAAMVKAAFLGATFNFQGNSVFYIKFAELADERMKQLFKINGENWRVANDRILIGSEGNGFSTMHISFRKKDGITYFVLPMMILEMEKLEDDKVTSAPGRKKIEQLSKEIKQIEVIHKEIPERETVTFALVEEPPLAPKCKTKWKPEKKKECSSEFIMMHVNRKFNTSLASELGIEGMVRISVDFIIDKEGKVVNIMAGGGPEILNQEAIKVMAQLPDFAPGTINGKPVNVSYKMPIMFIVQ